MKYTTFCRGKNWECLASLKKNIMKYKQYRQPNRCDNNGLLIILVSSTGFGQLFCPSSRALDCVLQNSKQKYISKYNQQAAVLHNLFISVKCSTWVRRFLRPSSGAQNFIYSIGYFVKPLLLPATVVAGSSKGLTKYPMLYIQFWVPDDGRRNRLKHVEHFTEINILRNVASRWLYLEIHLRCTDRWRSNLNKNLSFLQIPFIYWISQHFMNHSL